jgi:hypothetical protein
MSAMDDDGDPADLFRQFSEQYTDLALSGANPMLAAFGGWMTPGGGGTPLDPAESTKQAVAGLYQGLTDLPSPSTADAFDPSAWLDAWEAMGVDTEGVGEMLTEAPGQSLALLQANYLVAVLVVGQTLINTYAVRLLHDELVVEDHRNAPATLQWLWSQPETDREQLLRRTTDVDEGLVDDMQTVRKRRNEVLFSLGDPGALEDLQDPVADAERVLDVLQALEARLEDGTTFATIDR